MSSCHVIWPVTEDKEEKNGNISETHERLAVVTMNERFRGRKYLFGLNEPRLWPSSSKPESHLATPLFQKDASHWDYIPTSSSSIPRDIKSTTRHTTPLNCFQLRGIKSTWSQGSTKIMHTKRQHNTPIHICVSITVSSTPNAATSPLYFDQVCHALISLHSCTQEHLNKGKHEYRWSEEIKIKISCRKPSFMPAGLPSLCLRAFLIIRKGERSLFASIFFIFTSIHHQSVRHLVHHISVHTHFNSCPSDTAIH